MTHTQRPLGRRAASHAYNALAPRVLRLPYRDLQCGLKAAQADRVRPILDRTTSNGWAFDTEFITLAHRRSLRISEIPVDWVDRDSSARMVPVALELVRTVRRLRAARE